MAWRVLVVDCHSKLSYRNNHLLFQSAERFEQIHLSEIDVLILENTMITLTTMLIKRLVDERVVVIFCDDKSMPIANLSALYARYDSSAQLKKQLEWTPESKISVLKSLLRQKVNNQASLLRKNKLIDKIERIDSWLNKMEDFDPVQVEAQVARLYFTSLFGNSFNRNDINAINISLNYGYSILLSMCAREIVINGCITQLGINHCNQFNQFNLASDLMEPFRVIVDQIVYNNVQQSFQYTKRQILEMLNCTYSYDHKQVYLTNIVSDYVRRVIAKLNGEASEIIEFKYEL